jgi:DUF4097 and DUF4098 domain-containing protein YvlB
MLPRLAPLVLALGLAACHIHMRDHVEVDGVRLRAHHEETLTLDAWPAGGLVIAAHQGDVSAEHAEGPITITVVVHEREPGEAHAHFEGEKLVARAPNGGACAIGRVWVRAPGPVPRLVLSTGLGDVRMSGIEIEEHLSLSTGLGDVDVLDAGAPRTIELSSGMGDIVVARVHCTRLAADTGMGDVHIDGVEAEEAELSSGMGDVDVERSRGGRVTADTGLGDVELSQSSFASRNLDSGMGRVRER